MTPPDQLRLHIAMTERDIVDGRRNICDPDPKRGGRLARLKRGPVALAVKRAVREHELFPALCPTGAAVHCEVTCGGAHVQILHGREPDLRCLKYRGHWGDDIRHWIRHFDDGFWWRDSDSDPPPLEPTGIVLPRYRVFSTLPEGVGRSVWH